MKQHSEFIIKTLTDWNGIQHNIFAVIITKNISLTPKVYHGNYMKESLDIIMQDANDLTLRFMYQETSNM